MSHRRRMLISSQSRLPPKHSTARNGGDVNQVVVEGIVSSDVVRTELPSGDVLIRWTVRAPGPDERQHALPVAWVGAAARAPRLEPQDEVLVAGALQRRFFRSPRGLESRTEIRAQQVLRRPRGVRRRRVLEAACRRLGEISPLPHQAAVS